ncbi:MAG: UDP-glucose 4-epimerase GalE [Deltaproteobacteria bacterium]|nr:UDP-glucose 4-epimerase GalE [Deltaproteobacteria bacterium]
MNKSILVTGGAGYIGSHVCKALADKGYRPITFDNLSKGHEWAVQWGPLVKGDIHNTDVLMSAFQEYQPVSVMHFAASIEVGESVADPASYYYNNVSGSLNLVRCMLAAGIDKLVFSSTAATYGIPQSKYIDETHPQQPINPYGMSKLMVERIITDCGHANGLQHIFLRYFNACGADAENTIGESHSPESHLIPIIMQAAGGQRDKLFIFGDDYGTPDGTCLRDYIHVTDLASAHILALEALLNGAGSNVFNLGNGKGYSVLEILNAAEAVTGKKIPREIHDRREGDPPILVASSEKAKKTLGWKPKKNLEDILSSAWRWHCKQNGITQQ